MINIQVKSLVLYSLLAMILLIQACSGCGKDPGKETKKNDDNKPLEWDVTGNLFKANVKIESDIVWLKKLGMEYNKTKAVVIVESNNTVTNDSTNSTLAKAAIQWMEGVMINGVKNAYNVFYPDGNIALSPRNLGDGKFAIVRHVNPFPLEMYFAVAPKANNVETLDKTKELLAALYHDMLVCAYQAGMEYIVLHAISSGILASAGQEKAGSKKNFTKEEFVKITFEGMKAGIGKFQKGNPKHALRIILNNWDKLGDQQANDIAKAVIDKVKQLN